MNIIRIVNSIYTSNTYILSATDSNECWLIDIGDVQPVLDNIPKNSTIKGIFLTHTHYDHIYGINTMIELYPACVVYTSEHGKDGLFSDKLNLSRYHDDMVVFAGSHIHLLHEDDTVELTSNVYLHVLETPGHDWSSLTYYTEKEIFTGDSYIPDLNVVTTFPRSSKEDAEISTQKILHFAQGKNIYPGHGLEVIKYRDLIL